MCSYKIRFLWYDKIFVVSFTVVILNAALAVLSDKGQYVCVCVWGGGGGGGEAPLYPPLNCACVSITAMTTTMCHDQRDWAKLTPINTINTFRGTS